MHARLKSGFSFRIASFLVLPNAIYLKHLMLGYNDSVDEELNDGSLNFDNSLEMLDTMQCISKRKAKTESVSGTVVGSFVGAYV